MNHPYGINPVRGSAHYLAKLNEDDVRLIRRLRADGMTLVEIAEKFDVNHKTVHQIIAGRTWKHVA